MSITFPQTSAGTWLKGFLACYNESHLLELAAFVKTHIPPNARIGESDLVPIGIPHPQDITWLTELLYQQRGLTVVSIDEQSPTALAATALEQFPTLHGTVRLELRVQQNGSLEFFRMTSIPHAATASRTPPHLGANDERLRLLERHIRELVKLELFSGVVLVAHQGQILHLSAHGNAHHALQIRNTPQTRFNLASITKTFTATALLRLVQEKQMVLEKSIRHYLPDAPQAWSDITAHHLLMHTAGFGLAVLENDLHWLWKDRCTEMPIWWDLVRQRQPLESVGAKTLYSNVGYVILGQIIEKITQQGYYDFVQEVVFTPAAMRDTAFDWLLLEHPNRATGYLLVADAQQRQRPHKSHLREVEVRGGPHGFAYSNVRDLYTFSQALREYRLLDQKHTHKLLGLGKTLHDGYSFFCTPTHAGPVIHVSGAGPGISAWMDIHPTEDWACVILSNFGAPAAHRIGRRARQLLLEQAKKATSGSPTR